MRLLVIKNIRSPNTDVVFEEMARRLGEDFHVIYESAGEPNRHWQVSDRPAFSNETIPSRTVDLRRVAPDAFIHLPRTSRFAKRWKPDVVIASGAGVWSSPANLITLLQRRRNDWAFVPWWGSFANPLSQRSRGLREPLVRAFITRGDAWVAYGTRARAFLVARGAQADKVVISPNIARQPGPRRDLIIRQRSADTFLFVGQLIERKGIAELLAALALVPNARLRVAGAGPLDQPVRDAALQHGRVELLGELDWPALELEYLSARALILPSRYEAWGLVINEALDHGCPIVSTDAVGACDDLVVEGVNGLVVPSGNVLALAEALQSLLGWSTADFAACTRTSKRMMDDWSVSAAADGLERAAVLGARARAAPLGARRSGAGP